MTVALVIGGLLIVAGIAWCFLIQFWQKRQAAHARREVGPADVLSALEKLAKALFDAAKKFFPKPMLPGAFMMVLGALIVFAALAFGGDDDAGSTPTTPTTTTGQIGTRLPA